MSTFVENAGILSYNINKISKPHVILSLKGLIDYMDKYILVNSKILSTYEIVLCLKKGLTEFSLKCTCKLYPNGEIYPIPSIKKYETTINNILEILIFEKYPETCDRFAKSGNNFCLNLVIQSLSDVRDMVKNNMNLFVTTTKECIKKDNIRDILKRFELLIHRHLLLIRKETFEQIQSTHGIFRTFQVTDYSYNVHRLFSQEGFVPIGKWNRRSDDSRDVVNTSIESHLAATNEEICPVCRDQPLELGSDFAILNCCIHLMCVPCAEQLFFLPPTHKR